MDARSWKDLAAALSWNIRPFVDGHYRASHSKEFFETLNPATEVALSSAPVGDSTDINHAVAVARRRFDQGCWSDIPSAKRGEILLKLADLIVQRKGELALRDTLEMGKPIQASLYDAEVFAPTLLRAWAGFADKLLGSSAPLIDGTMLMNIWEPRGVVGAITPWNFPSVNAVYKLAPALAAGNTVVLKPSELAPSSALLLAEIAIEAGIPAGVFNVVPGLGSTAGSALASHPDVDMLSFTGSTVTGRKIMELASRSNGKPVLLECGGKSPHVVFDDVEDLDAVAENVARGILWNQGQVCTAHTRLLAQQSVKSQLLERVVSKAREVDVGDPLDEGTRFGPLASPAQRDRVKSYIEQGLRAGASAVLRGRIQEKEGCYVWPTIFDCVDSSMTIARDEIFGPVLTVQSFESEEEAVALANETDYRLGATVWTRDMGRGRRLAQQIKAGGIFIRTSGKEGRSSGCMLGHEPQRASGFGAERGLEGLQSYSTLKVITLSGA